MFLNEIFNFFLTILSSFVDQQQILVLFFFFSTPKWDFYLFFLSFSSFYPLSFSLYHYFLFTLPFSSFFFANFWYFLFPYHIHSIVFVWRISSTYNFWYMFDTSVRILKVTFHLTLHQISKNCPFSLFFFSLSPSSFGPCLDQCFIKWFANELTNT